MTAKTAAALAVMFLAGIFPLEAQTTSTSKGSSSGSTHGSGESSNGSTAKEKTEGAESTSSSSGSHGGGGGGGSGKGGQGPSFFPQATLPGRFQMGAGGKNRPSGGEAKGGGTGSSSEANEISDPVELANKLIQMFGGRSQDSSEADDDAPAPPPQPQYVNDLESSAEGGNAPAECWYAAWLLSEGTDKEIPETVTTTGANNSDSYNMAKDYLDKSAAQHYEPAEAMERILDNWTFTNEDTLKSQGDAELYYYLGKAFLTERNIVLPNDDANNRDPEVVTEYAKQERALALQILEYASKLGCPPAKLQLALMYANGYGAPQDPATAFNYAQDAATGAPVAANPEDGKAVGAFQNADQKALASDAEHQLGIFYVTGEGTDPNPDKATQYINEAEVQPDEAEAQPAEHNRSHKSKE